MGSQRLKVGAGVLCLALLVPGARAAGPPQPDDVAKLAARIDAFVAAGYAAKKAKPAAVADDAEFVRRAYLDLAGRIPRVSEVRAFLADKRPDKRRRLVDNLLGGPLYANHFTNVYRSVLLQGGNNQQVQFLAPQVENWVRARLRDNAPYDKMARDLLTAQAVFPRAGRGGTGGGGAGGAAAYDANAAAFYQANELKADNL